MRKRVAIFFTGGTISMKYDPQIGGAVPILSGKDIVASVPGLSAIADYEIIEGSAVNTSTGEVVG